MKKMIVELHSNDVAFGTYQEYTVYSYDELEELFETIEHQIRRALSFYRTNDVYRFKAWATIESKTVWEYIW